MKKCIWLVLLMWIFLLPTLGMAMSEYEWNVNATGKTTGTVILCEIDVDENGEKTVREIGSLPAGVYVKKIGGSDKELEMSKIAYYSNGEIKTAFIYKNAADTGATRNVDLTNGKVIHVNERGTRTKIAIVNNPQPDDRLNLRRQPNVASASLGKYYNGCVVTLLSGEINGWHNVQIGNLEGYMDARFLLEAQSGDVTSAMPILTIDNASGTGLHLREHATKSSDSLGLFSNGTPVQVLGLSKNWYHVQVKGEIGFMMASGFSSNLSFSSTSNTHALANMDSHTHRIAQWPLVIIDCLHAINNPKPTDMLHLRISPSENAQSLGKYYNGVLVIYNSYINDEWSEVHICGLTGYMKSEYLETDPMKYPNSAMPIMTVRNPNASQSLNLREKQSMYSKVLGTYTNGTEVILMGYNEEWAHVIVDGIPGFMLAKYLE